MRRVKPIKVVKVGTKCVQLTDSEKNLLTQLDFGASWTKHDAEKARAGGEAACELMKSLISRGAIPKIRVRWFVDSDYNIGGRGKSRKQVFERNGTRGESIFRHPHFLKYLRYFIYGPDLPASVIQDFEGKVVSCGRVSPSDVIPLANYARQQARAFGLDPSVAAEEFFKLALECGLDASDAGSIRSTVKRLRTGG